jgi:hypothetical protein
MALARVVTFDGVESSHVDELRDRIEAGERPDDLPATEIIVLHDPDTSTSLTVIFFDNDGDYARGSATLDSMPADQTPGTRTSVKKYRVAIRSTA